MKRQSLLLLMFLFFIRVGAQTLVSTEVQPRNAVLEEFTGIHCVYCPDGHAIAATILENNPGRALTIAIHQGSFAAPSVGEPDFRTPWGNALASQASVSGYPSGTVNRHVFSGSITALNRGDWVSRCNEIMAQDSPLNIGVESNYNEASRELTIHVELFYTSNAAQSSNFINVALIQDHVFGPQTGGNAGSNYEHMHMLRDLITGQWGDEITTTTEGSFVDRTYTYTVPEDFLGVPCVVENCQIAVFVTETHQEVITGDVVDAIGGTNQFIGNLAVVNEDIQSVSDVYPLIFDVMAKSNLPDGEEFSVSLTSENAPSDWEATISINGETYIGQATISLPYNVETPIQINVTPVFTAALAKYTLTMNSNSIPQAPAKYAHLYVVFGVENLVVNATGGPEAALHQGVYLNGLEAAGSSNVGLTDAEIMVKGINAQAFNNVRNIFLNVAWTFPALTIPQIEAVKAFMNGGGNLLIAGQDIGWDFMSGNAAGHGSPEATDFFQNYLHSNYVSDGSSTNNQFIAEPTDEIFGAVNQSAVVDVYGGNMYPEQITARENAFQVFYYDAAKTKCGAVRSETENYKVVYFGIGLEMIQNIDVRNQIIASALNWFNIGVGLQHADNQNLSIRIFPNPNSSGMIHFDGNANLKSIEIIDMTGKTIINQKVNDSEPVNIHNLKQGLYIVKMFSEMGIVTSKLSVK